MCFHFETFDLFRVDCGLVTLNARVHICGGRAARLVEWAGGVSVLEIVATQFVGCLFPIVEMVLNQPPQNVNNGPLSPSLTR